RHIFCLYTILPQPTTYTLSLHDALPICFNRLLNAADSIFNPTMADFIGTSIPYNPFGDYRMPIPSNQPLIDFATIHARDLNTSKLATLDLNIYTTDLFDLPAGGVRLAFGGVFIRETLT